jgi:Ubiquitin 3 binding protein But2 C-terminal domain
MKLSFLPSASLLAVAKALVVQDGGCTFKLSANGGTSGLLSQLGDGQNRVGGAGLTVATYTISADGIIFDQNGRGCILTPSTTQLQCDARATPTTGFAITCDGTFSYNGSSHFVACQTDDNGRNIYTTASQGQIGCVKITLNADSCRSGCSPISSPSSLPSTLPQPVAPDPLPAPPKTCTTYLSGAYEFPHLIIPVSATNPEKAYGTSYNGKISKSDIRSIFNFDIPQSEAGKTCSLVFLFPRQDQLLTSSFVIYGDAKISFASLSGVADQSTTHSNAPGVAKNYGVQLLYPGKPYTVATFDCPAGTMQSYLMSSIGTNFEYFQDYNPPG